MARYHEVFGEVRWHVILVVHLLVAAYLTSVANIAFPRKKMGREINRAGLSKIFVEEIKRTFLSGLVP